jgi:hypothetical protein
MEATNQELLILEVLWQEGPGVSFDSLKIYLTQKVGNNELKIHFRSSDQLAILNGLICKGLIGSSRSASHQQRHLDPKLPLPKSRRVDTRLASHSFTITRKGVSVILNAFGYDSTRYYGLKQIRIPHRRYTSYLVTTSERSRMQEMVSILSGLANYYGSIRNVGRTESIRGWTTRRGVHSKYAFVCRLDFDTNRSVGLDIDSLQMAHHCLLRNQWWRQMGFDARECLFQLSLGTASPVRVGEKYWGECETIVRNANRQHVTTVQVSQEMFDSLREKNATLLFRGFPWETATAQILVHERKFKFFHSSVGAGKLLLFDRLVGTIQCPASYTVYGQPNNCTFDTVQERTMSKPDLDE